MSNTTRHLTYRRILAATRKVLRDEVKPEQVYILATPQPAMDITEVQIVPGVVELTDPSSGPSMRTETFQVNVIKQLWAEGLGKSSAVMMDATMGLVRIVEVLEGTPSAPGLHYSRLGGDILGVVELRAIDAPEPVFIGPNMPGGWCRCSTRWSVRYQLEPIRTTHHLTPEDLEC